MKLYLNQASPYARLARALLIETGLDAQTEFVFVDPWDPTADDLRQVNPAAKVPALMLDGGEALIESACIAEYLIWRSGRIDLSVYAHRNPESRLRALGLGRAAIDCAFGAVVQKRFAPGSPLAERWRGQIVPIATALDALYEGDGDDTTFDLSDLTVAVAYEYADFRCPDVDWRAVAARLARRVGRLGERPSLRLTRPA